jgi:hypothetical protein
MHGTRAICKPQKSCCECTGLCGIDKLQRGGVLCPKLSFDLSRLAVGHPLLCHLSLGYRHDAGEGREIRRGEMDARVCVSGRACVRAYVCACVRE